MNVALWIVAGVLAAAFADTGSLKLTQSNQALCAGESPEQRSPRVFTAPGGDRVIKSISSASYLGILVKVARLASGCGALSSKGSATIVGSARRRP
jgi:hypothetical protein